MTRMSVAFLLCFAPAIASATSAYFVGNSLSWDALTGGSGMISVFQSGGRSLDPEYHIRCNSSLHNTRNSPLDPCVVSTDGTWDVALPSFIYDIVVFQPHQGGTTEQEIAAIQYFSGLNAADVVIYEAYPPRDDIIDILAYYALPDQSDFRQTRAEFDQIRAAFPNATYVPAMDVIIELDERARQGRIPGIETAYDLYRDAGHMDVLGRYALALTFFAVLTGEDPAVTGLDLHPLYAAVTDVQALEIQAAVNEVVLDGPANVVPVPLPLPWLVLLAVMLGLAPAMLRRKLAPNSR